MQAEGVKKGEVSRQVDTFMLQTAALILCRGTPEEKAKALLQIALQQFNSDFYKQRIYWENLFLKRALRFLFYFCTVMPFRYLEERRGTQAVMDVLLHEKSGFKTAGQRASEKGQKKVDKFFSNKEEKVRINRAEKYFDEVF